MQHKRIPRQPRWHVMVSLHRNTHSKVHGANMGPIWGRQDPGGPNVGPMNCYLGRPCFAGSSIIVHVLTNTKSMANLNIHLWRHCIWIAITNFIHCISHYKEHDQMGHPCKKKRHIYFNDHHRHIQNIKAHFPKYYNHLWCHVIFMGRHGRKKSSVSNEPRGFEL